MGVTKFGKILRTIRLDHDEILLQMADKLNVSPSYLSSIEHGKRNVPEKWVDKLKDTYNLSEETIRELCDAALEQKSSVKFRISHNPNSKNEILFALARSLDELDDDKINQIKAILNNEDGKQPANRSLKRDSTSRTNYVQVAPLSRVDIREFTLKIKKVISIQDQLCFPVLHFFENIMPILFEDFDYEYVDQEEMEGAEGLMIPEISTIRIPINTVKDAARGIGRARFTIAHEIGHFFLHRNQSLVLCRSGDHIPPYRNSEWQANTFAGELLVPFHLTKEMNVEEVMRKCKVSRQAAECQLNVK